MEKIVLDQHVDIWLSKVPVSFNEIDFVIIDTAKLSSKLPKKPKSELSCLKGEQNGWKMIYSNQICCNCT